MKPKVNLNRLLTDEIYFDHSKEDIDGGIMKTVEYIINEEEIKINARGVASVIYNASLKNIEEPIMFQKIDK